MNTITYPAQPATLAKILAFPLRVRFEQDTPEPDQVERDEQDTPEPEAEPDLDRLYFRVDGVGAVSAADATDEQFHAWASALARIEADAWRPWSRGERAAFVAWCERHGIRFAYTAP